MQHKYISIHLWGWIDTPALYIQSVKATREKINPLNNLKSPTKQGLRGQSRHLVYRGAHNRQSIITIYRNSINYVYSSFYILSIIFPIWTIYTFSILLPIISLYRLTIGTLYRHLYIKYIEITYNITYKGSLYFAIPDVRVT